MESPKPNEYWYIEHKPSNVLVRVVEEKKVSPNWIENKFKCLRFGSVVFIKGNLFIEQLK